VKLVVINKVNGITSTTPFVEEIRAEAGGIVIYTVLPSQDGSPRMEFIKWDPDLTFELRK
jgi:hypothetical protein